ncbi:MAG: hypothetical protein DRP60_04025 [Spirochaetes bacterium]|nr:MAG: hypothetical protein DRP60_04025 [Spirochaetota bacterium]
MAQYYFLVSSLVELSLDEGFQKHPYPVFKDFVREELSGVDYTDLRKCFLLNDVSNFTAVLKSDSAEESVVFLEPAYYEKETLVEGLIDTETLFPFLADFIWDYRAERRLYPGISAENELLLRMMEYISAGDEPAVSGFPGQYLEFEMHLRNLTTALFSRAAGDSWTEKIIPFDFFSQRIAESQAADFGLGGDLGVLSDLIDLHDGSTPLEIEKAITAARWNWLDEAVGYNLFSREAVFAYAVKIADVERWLTLTPEEGRVKLDELLEQLHQNIKKITREENS